LRRAAALRHSPERRWFVVAHGAARLILARHLGVPAERVTWDRGPNGKPEPGAATTGLAANLSHSGDLALLAVTGGRRVGVDVQLLAPECDVAALARRFFPDREARYVSAAPLPAHRADRFARLWTRKEACVKVTGGRLTQGLGLVVRGDGPTGRVVVGRPDGALPGPYLVRNVPVPPGFRAAVALEGTRPYRVVRHRWRPEP
jgi:4'-phosphopantetheinyl transferase